MKTKEANQTTLSGKKLILFVACVATICILNSLDIQARDYKDLLAKKYGYDAIDYKEPTPILPGTVNLTVDFNYKIVLSGTRSRSRTEVEISDKKRVAAKPNKYQTPQIENSVEMKDHL